MRAWTLALSCLTAALSLPAQALIDGFRPDPGQHPVVDRVVLLSGPKGCTGTLLTDRLVLTAAHCILPDVTTEGLRDHTERELRSIREIRVSREIPGTGRHEILGHARDLVLRKYQYDSRGNLLLDDSRYRGAFGDIALLYLEDAKQARFAHSRVALGSDLMDEELDALVAFGFGWTCDSPACDSQRLFAKRNEGDVGRSEEDTLRITSSRPFLCEGDSGGPLFRRAADGTYQLVGVAARRDGLDVLRWLRSDGDGCKSAGRFDYVSVRRYLPWIQAAARRLHARNGNSLSVGLTMDGEPRLYLPHGP